MVQDIICKRWILSNTFVAFCLIVWCVAAKAVEKNSIWTGKNDKKDRGSLLPEVRRHTTALAHLPAGIPRQAYHGRHTTAGASWEITYISCCRYTIMWLWVDMFVLSSGKKYVNILGIVLIVYPCCVACRIRASSCWLMFRVMCASAWKQPTCCRRPLPAKRYTAHCSSSTASAIAASTVGMSFLMKTFLL